MASEILLATIRRLDSIGKSLWTEVLVLVDGLKSSYNLEELFFIEEDGKSVGVVFLQTSDPKFWPKISDANSLFFHKLAIHPEFSGCNRGEIAIDLILEFAKNNGFRWVHLDCDNRIELLKFYQSIGFSHVDTLHIGCFQVARHQMLTN